MTEVLEDGHGVLYVCYWRTDDPSEDASSAWMVPNTGDPQNDND